MAHDHHSHHQVKDYNRAFIIGLVLNIAFVVIEFGYGLKVNSLALIADAAHNLGDVFGLLLSWAGLLASRKVASEKFSYGWKKASIIAAFVNSVILLVAMGTLAWEAILRFKQPVIQTESETVIIVATVGIIINSVTAYMFMSGRKNDINLQGAFLHMAADALISFGVVIAGVLTLYFESSMIDPVTSLIIVLVIVVGTLRLFQKSVHMLFDGVPENISFEQVKNYLQSQPGVVQVQDLRIWNLSSTEVALTAHLIMPHMTSDEHFLEKIEKHLRRHFGIEHITIQLDKKLSHHH
jgi:cobalt-zinc-cadmium efflux system protein